MSRQRTHSFAETFSPFSHRCAAVRVLRPKERGEIKPLRALFPFLVQNKHSTRSGYEASEAMLIFVIMGGQWMDGFFGELSARAVNSPPPSCYKDSIEQVAPAMPCACHEPN